MTWAVQSYPMEEFVIALIFLPLLQIHNVMLDLQ